MVKVTKSIKIYQYFRYLKFASSASQNAGKCVSKSLEIQISWGGGMPPDPPREQGPPGLATPTQINATPTSKTVENPVLSVSLRSKRILNSTFMTKIGLIKG